MVFSSIEFLCLFLPVFIFFYSVFPKKNITLLSFSILFYTWGEGYFVSILIFTIIINWALGKLITAYQSNAGSLLFLGVSVNISILAIYKYSDFIINDILGMGINLAVYNIRLPIGISFFTFQAISYLVDIYRSPERKAVGLVAVGSYISMFPQLIAGPIVRYASVASALNNRRTSLENFRFGLFYFAVGLAQKSIIANTLAENADLLFALEPAQLSTSAAWLAAITYSLQIYFDFSGYSHMAIGLGYMLGFVFPDNFNFPYLSLSVTEFWRRWHISLSTWFRDYLYIPLGGSRKGTFATYRNLIVVFFLCGLWHGASWTFVFWGAYHGLLLVCERRFIGNIIRQSPLIISRTYTLMAVVIGWIFFRADNLRNGMGILNRMILPVSGEGLQSAGMYLNSKFLIALIAAVLFSTKIASAILQPMAIHRETLELYNDRRIPKFAHFAWAISFLLFMCAAFPIFAGAYNPFIYFRF